MTAITRRAIASPWRLAVGLLLLVHGLIHVLGPLDIWNITDVEQLTGVPSVAIGSAGADVVAVGWLLALAALMAAGVAVLTRRPWWSSAAIAGVIVSQVMVVIWWQDAFAGTIANVLIAYTVVRARSPRIARTDGGSRG